MAMNRIQFQAGLSLTQFLEQYGTEERCEQALELAQWPNGFRRENCASIIGLKVHKGNLSAFVFNNLPWHPLHAVHHNA